MTLETFAARPENCVFKETFEKYKLFYTSYDHGFLFGYLLSAHVFEKITDEEFDNLANEFYSIYPDDDVVVPSEACDEGSDLQFGKYDIEVANGVGYYDSDGMYHAYGNGD